MDTITVKPGSVAYAILKAAAGTVELRGLTGNTDFVFTADQIKTVYTYMRVSTLYDLELKGFIGVFDHVRDVLRYGASDVVGVD